MKKTLIITIEFEDESDFDFFRPRFVGACEEIADVAVNGDDDEPARADCTIEVGWEVDES